MTNFANYMGLGSTGVPVDGDVLVWDAATHVWVPQAQSALAPDIDDGTTASTTTTLRLAPDGLGGVQWAATAVNFVAGVAGSYKVARGVHQQATASDTVAAGLTTVVAVVVAFRDAPTVKQLFCAASIGNQSGAPAAGSFLLNTYKPTAVDNVTPTAATDFTDNISFDWIAVGT